MPIVLIDLDGAKPALVGSLTRRLLEIRPGVFVGSLSARAIEQTWASVVESNPKSAMLVKNGANELGLDIKTIGLHRYQKCENHGISLVTFIKMEKIK